MRGRHICRVGHIQVRRPLETSQSDRRSDYVLRPARRNSESQRSAGSPHARDRNPESHQGGAPGGPWLVNSSHPVPLQDSSVVLDVDPDGRQ